MAVLESIFGSHTSFAGLLMPFSLAQKIKAEVDDLRHLNQTHSMYSRPRSTDRVYVINRTLAGRFKVRADIFPR
jgi:hypothetical protein